MKNIFVIISFILCIATNTFAQHPQGLQTDFGKNRIQYQDFAWNFYRTDQFDTYFYLGGKELAIYTAEYAQITLKEIEKLMDYRLSGRLIFIIYNKLSDLRQSNLGIPEEQYNIGGLTKIVGNKAFIYYNGDHDHLNNQIRKGISRIIINEMLFGGDIKEMMQNATLLNLPNWYIDGLTSFISEDWNIEMDNYMRDGIMSGQFKKFNQFKEQDPTLAGHSIWNYIAQNYGYSAISNIIYMTRINRNIESGFLFVLGASLKKLGLDWLNYYQNIYTNEDTTRTLPDLEPIFIKPKRYTIYNQFKTSPNGQKIAYSTNKQGKYKVWIYDIERKQKKKILKFGYKAPEYINNTTIPILSWHPSGRMIAIAYEKKAEYWISLYELESGVYTDIPMRSFEQILDIDYAYDAKTIALAAVQRGHSDIFLFNVNSRTHKKITNDIYDDNHPRFIRKSWQLVFDSNRPDDSLYTVLETDSVRFQNKHDIFLYNQSNIEKPLTQLTFTPNINETQPIEFDSSYIAYLSDVNGIQNMFIGKLDSTLDKSLNVYKDSLTSYPVSNYSRNLISYYRNADKELTNYVFYKDGRYYLYSEKEPTETYLEQSKTTSLDATRYAVIQYERMEFEQQITDTIIVNSDDQPINTNKEPITGDSVLIDIDNYVFEPELVEQSRGDKRKQHKINALKSFSLNKGSGDSLADAYTRKKVNVLKIRPYETAFSTSYIITQLDNSNLNSSYQRFTGLGPVYFQNPGLNAFVKIGINDLFEDYKIYGGFRMPGDLNNIEYFVSYENLRKRLDRQVFYYKNSFLRYTEEFFNVFRIKSQNLRYILKWPFSERISFRINSFLRYDKSILLATGVSSLPFPNYYDAWVGSRLEYVFDNTVSKALNIRYGTRYKIHLEGFQNLLQKNQSFTGSLGLDFRHYQKIHRNIIWASRLATAASFGGAKIVYFLGGTNNWLSPKYDTNIEVANQQDYVYQTLVTNLRGFKQNIRNGNKVAAVNTEIRFPIISYFYEGPIKSDFLRNFQVISFVDVGTAWVGASPFSEGNAFNTDIIDRHPLKITVSTLRNPIVWGYGLGARSRLLGYFVRADLGWGYEDMQGRKPMLYISFSKDF